VDAGAEPDDGDRVNPSRRLVPPRSHEGTKSKMFFLRVFVSSWRPR